MDVFKAFPKAMISGVWQIAPYQRGSLVGTAFNVDEAINLDVIVDEGNSSTISSAPDAEPLDADLLMYAQPGQLPVTNTRALVSGYLLHNNDNDDYFAIVDASVGKNQETGEVEHIELLLKQTEVA